MHLQILNEVLAGKRLADKGLIEYLLKYNGNGKYYYKLAIVAERIRDFDAAIQLAEKAFSLKFNKSKIIALLTRCHAYERVPVIFASTEVFRVQDLIYYAEALEKLDLEPAALKTLNFALELSRLGNNKTLFRVINEKIKHLNTIPQPKL